MEILEVLGYLGAIATGLVLGVIGGGGALMSVPVLVYIFKVDAHTATGYSMFIVGVTALYAAYSNIKQKLVDIDAVLWYGVPSVVSVFVVRSFVLPGIPEILPVTGWHVTKDMAILSLLSIVMILIGYKMIWGKNKTVDEVAQSEPVNYIGIVLYALVIGAFLGLVGAGGGILMAPALMHYARLQIKTAIATSLVLVAFNSFVGFVGEISANPMIDWYFLARFTVLSVAGMVAGLYISKNLKAELLKQLFGWFVLLLGIYIAINEVSLIIKG